MIPSQGYLLVPPRDTYAFAKGDKQRSVDQHISE